jgi:hypothetical protein
MPSHAAIRFAQAVYDEHCHEGTFVIAVSSVDALPVVEALESLGCKVTRHPFKDELTVVCPADTLSRKSN